MLDVHVRVVMSAAAGTVGDVIIIKGGTKRTKKALTLYATTY